MSHILRAVQSFLTKPKLHESILIFIEFIEIENVATFLQFGVKSERFYLENLWTCVHCVRKCVCFCCCCFILHSRAFQMDFACFYSKSHGLQSQTTSNFKISKFPHKEEIKNREINIDWSETPSEVSERVCASFVHIKRFATLLTAVACRNAYRHFKSAVFPAHSISINTQHPHHKFVCHFHLNRLPFNQFFLFISAVRAVYCYAQFFVLCVPLSDEMPGPFMIVLKYSIDT